MDLYKPVRPKKIADQVFEQVRDLIFNGQLKPGEQVPPQRELAARLGVSRPSVREAMGRLVHLGLISQQQGQGTFVCAPSSETERNPLRALAGTQGLPLGDFLEMCSGPEGGSAALAARRAHEEDFALLEQSLADMERQLKHGSLSPQEDGFFHVRLASAAQNPGQASLIKHLHDLRLTDFKEKLAKLYTGRDSRAQLHAQHRAVLAAVKSRDHNAAREAMLAHLDFEMARLRPACQTPQAGSPSAAQIRRLVSLG